jgi:hypothetical protein
MKTRFYQILAVSALCLAAAALAIALWTSARAQDEAPQAALAIPTTLNYQGYLREPDGSLTTGTYGITAKIYNIATGGSPLYTTTLPVVTVRDGLFNIVLGDDPALPSSVFASAPLYIGISLDGGAELIPRQRLHAVPWAFQASTLISNATVQGLTSNGNVTVNGDTAMNGNAAVTGNAIINGNVVITGTLSHPGETFVGPHFLDPIVPIKSWGPCPVTAWITVDKAEIPSGATAVILEYAAQTALSSGAWITVRKASGAASYILAVVRANVIDDIGWGGQGIYPILADGSFQYIVNQNITNCSISLIGYFK